MQHSLFGLKPGTRFRLVGMPEITGELLDCSECSAKVRIDGGEREVTFEDTDGQTRHFRARRMTTTTWAPSTVVEPISTTPETEDTNMARSKKTTTKTSKQPKAKAETPKAKAPAAKRTKAPAAKKAEATKAPAAAKPPKADGKKKVSALDAAAMILAAKKEPMNAQEMIAAMAEAKLWESPGGKTPHATLYAAIVREINAKGEAARFKKTEKGKFAIAG